MNHRVAVLADDLTGAAEIAALGARCGRRAIVAIDVDENTNVAADLIVIDTDTRLDPPDEAARRVAIVALTPVVAAAPVLFKKTDSVLRGPVRAELAAIARLRGAARILLVPANPALGRIVSHGRYVVHGRPVCETAFARDPHHPVLTDDVLAMLGAGDGGPACSLKPTDPMPASGFIVGDASTADDLATWAGRIDEGTLPAGAAGFFGALLATLGWRPQTTESPRQNAGPVLILCGTKNPAPPPATAFSPSPAFTMGDEIITAHSEEVHVRWAETIAAALRQHGRAIVTTTSLRRTTADTPERIRRAFAGLVASLHARASFAHLVIEGGATASAVVRHLGWTSLIVTQEWAQGVVTLQPTDAPSVDLTIKPGSYAWPEAFWKLRLDADRLPPRGGRA